jgi:hypothetical protein
MRAVSGSAAAAVHEVGIGDLDQLVELARQATVAYDALEKLGREVAAAAKSQDPKDRTALLAISRSLLRLAVRCRTLVTRLNGDIDRSMRRAAQVSEDRAKKKLEDERKKTGRPQQPDAFIGFAGGRAAQFGSRRRLSSAIESGVVEAAAGTTRLAFQVQIGILGVLEKATDRRGEPVWMHVEYGQTNGGPQHGKMGAFFAPGQSAPAKGLRRSQAVFVPTKMRPAGGLRVRHPARAYNYLRAGRTSANASLRPAIAAASSRAERELKSIAREQARDLAALRRIGARVSNETRRDTKKRRR